MNNLWKLTGAGALLFLLIGGCTSIGDQGALGPGDVPQLVGQETSLYPFQAAGTDGPPEAAGVSLEDVAAGKVVGCTGGFDCIPNYSYPDLVRAVDARYVDDGDLVLGVALNGTARAYPLSTLWTHEIANDTVGGIRVTVNYCPLTGTGLVFKGTIDGEPATFGVSGLLYNNNLILYDHQTQSLWPQMLYTAAQGTQKGRRPELLPVREMTWAAWKTLYPSTTVVTSEYHSSRYPYGSYRTDHSYILFRQTIDTRLRAKDVVMGVIGLSTARAYPFERLGDRAVINDMLDGEPIAVLFDANARTTAVFKRPVTDKNEIVELEKAGSDEAFPFKVKAAGFDAVWEFTGEGTEGMAVGNDLVPVATAWQGFWFAWAAYYPEIEIWSE